MEGEQVGWLIFFIALAIVLFVIVQGMVTGQYNLWDKLVEKLVFK
jgi:hypothetical protein